MINDLDGDGRPEVLFSFQTTSETGKERSSALTTRAASAGDSTAGRELMLDRRAFRREYRIFGFNVEDYDGDGALEVLAVSIHKPDWPCQAVLLDAAGKPEGEYWNAGYLMDAQLGDLDGDGVKELVLSGVNNEYGRGCVAIFEAGGLRGGSPQEHPATAGPISARVGGRLHPLPEDRCPGGHPQRRRPGQLFLDPRGRRPDGLDRETQIFYDLDRTLACRDVNLSNDFKNLHEKYRPRARCGASPTTTTERPSGMPSCTTVRRLDWRDPATAPARGRTPSTAGSSGGPVRGPKPQISDPSCRPAGGDVRSTGAAPFAPARTTSLCRTGPDQASLDPPPCRLEAERRPALFLEKHAAGRSRRDRSRARGGRCGPRGSALPFPSSG